MRRGTRERHIEERDESSQVEILKTEVLKSIARAFECSAEESTGVPDFDQNRGVNFYEEVTKFEIELIKQALMCTSGNQRLLTVRSKRLTSI